MKITIDTKEDSHSEIKKVIRMLQQLIGDEIKTNSNIFENSETSGFINMFGDNSQPSNQKEETQMFNFYDQETKKEQKEESKDVPPTMQFY